MKRFAIALIVAIVAAGALLSAGAQGWLGRAPAAGQPTPRSPRSARAASTGVACRVQLTPSSLAHTSL